MNPTSTIIVKHPQSDALGYAERMLAGNPGADAVVVYSEDDGVAVVKVSGHDPLIYRRGVQQ